MVILQMNRKTEGGSPIYGNPGGLNAPILTKNDQKYWYYPNTSAFSILNIWSCKVQYTWGLDMDNTIIWGHTLSWMYICGYFALSNGPNREVPWIILIFGVNFGQNIGIWPPGVPIYRVTPRCFAIYFEEIVSCFVLYVPFLYFVSWKVRNGKKTTILTFLVKN